jgi:asparagine synthetase B (glutamine-hydrolysing)
LFVDVEQCNLEICGWNDCNSLTNDWNPFPQRIATNNNIDNNHNIDEMWKLPIPVDEEDDGCGSDDGVCQRVLCALGNAVERRVASAPKPLPALTSATTTTTTTTTTTSMTIQQPAKVAVLFSGGVDSAILAAMVDKCFSHNNNNNNNNDNDQNIIDLINVSFAGEKAPDRVTARATLVELQALSPNRVWRLIAVDIDDQELQSNLVNTTTYRFEINH